jgi:hypothetical protein
MMTLAGFNQLRLCLPHSDLDEPSRHSNTPPAPVHPALEQLLRNALLADGLLTNQPVEINAFYGTVRLSGGVSSYAARSRAVELVRDLAPGMAVQDCLEVH